MDPSRTLICCPIAVDGIAQLGEALERGGRAVAAGARVIEWRADLLAEEDGAVDALRTLVRDSPAPCIVTIRPTWEGGMYGASESQRVSLLEALGTGEHAPRYLDVELDAYRTSRNRRQKLNLAVDHPAQVREVVSRLILSSHDFRGRPDDLLQRVAAMASEPACAVMKLAWMARSLRDNLEAFELLGERSKPMVALCMGEFGLLSRVLAPKFGGFLTFASLDAGQESAPGQPTIAELRDRYRFDRIGPATALYGVIGWPVASSRSPAVHNAGFDARGRDAVYLPLPVPPEYEHFKATVGAMLDHRALDFRGASVTAPHKEHCVRFVRERGGEVDALCEALGAANTLGVSADGGAIRCANTDASAAAAVLAESLGRADDLTGANIAVLGNGGVARAIAGGVAMAGGNAVLFGRTPANVARVVGELSAGLARIGARGKVVAGNPTSLDCGCYEAFVNGTPVGMAGGPDPGGSPLAQIAELGGVDDVRLDGIVVFDTVYAPAVTPLLREARERGARCVGGLVMFVRQAEAQFRIWTGVDPPEGLFLERAGEADRIASRG